jgi:hypothetical protein
VKKPKEEYSKNTQTSQDTLEFILSLPIERKLPKVSKSETVHATAAQQEEMERLLKKNKKE